MKASVSLTADEVDEILINYVREKTGVPVDSIDWQLTRCDNCTGQVSDCHVSGVILSVGK